MENQLKSYQTSVAHCISIPPPLFCISHFKWMMQFVQQLFESHMQPLISLKKNKTMKSHHNHLGWLEKVSMHCLFTRSFTPPSPSPLASHASAWQPGRGCSSRIAGEQKSTPMMCMNKNLWTANNWEQSVNFFCNDIAIDQCFLEAYYVVNHT